jgi:hypothetical protein
MAPVPGPRLSSLAGQADGRNDSEMFPPEAVLKQQRTGEQGAL